MRFDTRAIHDSLNLDPQFGSSTIPIFQTASYAYPTAQALADVFQGKKYGHAYSRNSNPTVAAFEAKVKGLEDGIGSVATATGMAAIAAVVFSLAQAGDTFVTSSSLFGGTYHLFEDMKQFGITPLYVDANDAQAFKNAITDTTRFVYVEAIGNPKIDVPDIQAIGLLCQARGIPLVVDATLVSPYLFQAKKWGVSVVLHSATKYMGIGGSTLGGVLTDTGLFDWNTCHSPGVKKWVDKVGSFAFLAKARKQMVSNVGATLSPLNAFLLHLGLETLSLRLDKHVQNAQAVAEFLKEHPKVKDVFYCGLKQSPFHERAAGLFSEKYGALMSIRLGSKEACYAMIDALKLVSNQANIGGSKTLAIHPFSTIYHDCSDVAKHDGGVYEDLVRISVGLEDRHDIVADFEQALR